MFVKPGRRQDDPALPLIVRGPNKRLLSVQGENVPEITFWYRRLLLVPPASRWRRGAGRAAGPSAAAASTGCDGYRDSAGGRPCRCACDGRRFRVAPAASRRRTAPVGCGRA
jgi:hypothetical protein